MAKTISITDEEREELAQLRQWKQDYMHSPYLSIIEALLIEQKQIVSQFKTTQIDINAEEGKNVTVQHKEALSLVRKIDDDIDYYVEKIAKHKIVLKDGAPEALGAVEKRMKKSE